MLGHLRQVRANPQGCYAVHIRLSDLRASNKQPHFLNIAARSFEVLIANQLANLFPLSNGDVVLVCRDTPVEEVDTVVKKVRTLFAEDPLTAAEYGSTEDHFSTWYDLTRTEDFKAFVAAVNDLVAAAEARQKQAPAAKEGAAGSRPAKSEGAPLAPKNLVIINQKLRATQVADLIRSQTALNVVPGSKAQIVFREHFVAIGELKTRVAPDINLFANPWLFQYLTETLDKRVLAVMARRNFATLPDAISLNLNINTILTRDWELFRAAVGEHTAKVVIEMQLIDIFSDVNRFDGVRANL
ncbi:MAG: hypothetical protein EXQ86_01170 [Rhodospirillales bacterium]|nr:hypothetical protein [Rhodospirillales bacterium]